jgi:hypothetical protein
VLEFARAFRALPAVKFHETHPALADPVAVRVGEADGSQFLYAVNRFAYPVTCRLRTAGTARELRDLAGGAPMPVAPETTLELGPFQLRSFQVEGGVLRIVGGEEIVAPEVAESLTARLTGYEKALDRARERLADPQDTAFYIEEGKRLAQAKRWADLHYLMQERWAVELDEARKREPRIP